MSDYISHDLLALILKYLPVKTLLRFRCVSKPWNQLISSQSFISDHLSLQTPRPFITQNEGFNYLRSDPQHTPLLDRITLPDDDHSVCHFSAVSSVHGVICLYDYDYSDLLFLWNPSIRRILRIPPPVLPGFRMVDRGFKYCGLWIDPSTNHFKIVLFCVQGENAAAVFSSTKRGWTEVAKAEMDGFSADDESAQALIDGVAHWIASKDFDYGVIVSFDFGQDKLGTIELPADLNDVEDFGVNVCKWQGALSVLNYDAFGSRKCELWAMKDGLWSRMFSCKLPERFFDAFCVLESCGSVLALTEDRELVLYDPKYRRTVVKYEWMDIGHPAFAYDFVESLVFPDRKCISSDD